MNTKDLDLKFEAERSAYKDEIKFYKSKISDLEVALKRQQDENKRIDDQS
jgi:hypothetical protein